MKVYKYQHHQIEDKFEINMPASARVVGFEILDGKPTIWALIDPKEINNRVKRFRLAGTGHDINIEKDPNNLKHIATVLDREIVWHLFEVLYGDEAFS